MRYTRSTWLKWGLCGLAGVFVLLLVFDAGLAVGMHRAMEFHRGPMGPGQALHGYIPEGHGAVGTITDISLPLIHIQDRDGDTEEILISPDTVITTATGTAAAENLTVGQQVVVLGNPAAATSSEQLQAKMLRVMPPSPPNR